MTVCTTHIEAATASEARQKAQEDTYRQLVHGWKVKGESQRVDGNRHIIDVIYERGEE